MSKRPCSSSSGCSQVVDKNPQNLVHFGTVTYANVSGAQVASQAMPNPAWEINRATSFSCPKKALVMELLRCVLEVEGINGVAAAATAPISQYQAISLVNLSTLAPLSSTVGFQAFLEWMTQTTRNTPQVSGPLIAKHAIEQYASTTPTGGAAWQNRAMEQAFDLCDSDGNGIIVGGPNFYLLWGFFCSNTPGSGNLNAVAHVTYRYKEISYEDWVRQFAFGM